MSPKCLGANFTLASGQPRILQRTQLPAQSLPQATHGVSPCPTETTVQLPENRARSLRGSDHCPGPNGCRPVPSFVSEKPVLILASFFFCLVPWQYEVGDENLILINVIFGQHKLILFQEGVCKL